MSITIETLKQELNDLEVASEAKRIGLTAKLQEKLNAVFNDDGTLQKAIAAVESASMYMWNQYGEISQWWRFAELERYADDSEYLEAYLSDRGINIDWRNDCLELSCGPNIIINSDGDVLDQDGDKWFIKKRDYTKADGEVDIALRNQLIEQYMEKTGCFPGVFYLDYYGNVFAVNTKEKE